jgi:hypothetical protein
MLAKSRVANKNEIISIRTQTHQLIALFIHVKPIGRKKTTSRAVCHMIGSYTQLASSDNTNQ